MPASAKLIPPALLSLVLTAALCVAPAAQASKKDLFASEPTGNSTTAAPQMLSEQTTEAAPSTQETVYEPLPAPELQKEAEPSALEKQWTRLKKNLNKTKKDLFGNEPRQSKQAQPAPALVQVQDSSDATASSSSTDSRPQISATEAAQRAQRAAEGQVMNVRKVQDEDKTLYNVNLLQKNGRMKTVNIDAHSGEVVEEATPN